MGASEPTQLHQLFAKYLNSADVDGLLSLYEEDSAFVASPDGSVRTGGGDVRRAGFESYLGLKPTIEFIGSDVAIVSGDLALIHGRFRMKIEGMDDIEAATAEVARRQSDGTWKYVIDNPWGTAVLGE